MKVLFASESIWKLGIVYDVHMLAEGINNLNHDVYVIGPGQDTEDSNSFLLKYEEISRFIKDSKIKLVSPKLIQNEFKLPIKSNWLNYQFNRFCKRYYTLDKLLKENKFDIIVLYSAARLGLATILLAKKYNLPIVFRNIDMLHKLWPDPLSKKIVKELEKIVYSNVDHLCALTPSYSKYLQDLGADKAKISKILFPINTKQFYPKQPSISLREKWNISAKDKVIVWIGTFYKFGGILELIDKSDTLFELFPNCKLILVGDGVIKQEIIDLVKRKNLESNIIITGQQPFELMPEFVNLADFCINVFPINKKTDKIFSAKIVQYQACGKPTISSGLMGIKNVIPAKGAGVIYSNQISEIVELCIQLFNNTKLLNKLSLECIDYVNKNHQFNVVLNEFNRDIQKTKKIKKKFSNFKILINIIKLKFIEVFILPLITRYIKKIVNKKISLIKK